MASEQAERGYCALCGKWVDAVPDMRAAALAHIAECEKHPMREVERQRDKVLALAWQNAAACSRAKPVLEAVRAWSRELSAGTPAYLTPALQQLRDAMLVWEAKEEANGGEAVQHESVVSDTGGGASA